MTKNEIIAKTLRDSNCTSDDSGVVELLQGRLPDGVDIKTCEDFKHFNVECCDTCHNFLPESEMYLIDLPDGGKAWVCDQVRGALLPETKLSPDSPQWEMIDWFFSGNKIEDMPPELKKELKDAGLWDEHDAEGLGEYDAELNEILEATEGIDGGAGDA